MANQVYIDEHGFIREVYEGDQTKATALAIVHKTEQFIRELQIQNKPIFIIVDARLAGRSDIASRGIGAKIVREWPYKKIAIFGANRFLKAIVHLILNTVARQMPVRLFDTEEEAVAWLKS